MEYFSAHLEDLEELEIDEDEWDIDIDLEEEIDNSQETITEKIDFEYLNKKIDNINFTNIINNLDSINISIDSNIKEENEYLKKLLIEIENNDLIKDKIESAKIIKELTEENKRLENIISRLNIKIDVLDNLLKDSKKLRDLLDYQQVKLNSYQNELNHYKNKEKNLKKKKYNLSDLLNLRAEGKTYREIAKLYGVKHSTIYYRINKARK